MIRLSIGTTAVLGLSKIRCATLPTIGYLLVGDRCHRACAFCSQGKDQNLSRIPWLPFPLADTVEKIAVAYDEGKIAGICIQTLGDGSSQTLVEQLVVQLRRRSEVSIALCTHKEEVEVLGRWKELGVNRFGLPLDAACEAAYRRTKPGSFSASLSLLEKASRLFPGDVSTHLIVGLGETEKEMVDILQRLVDWGTTVGLFALTPIPGTPYGRQPPPDVACYRRVQAAYYLLRLGMMRKEDFAFNEKGELVDFGLEPNRLRRFLATGEAFRTTGCPGCNRPYYNERVRGPLYNYPRPLTPEELEEAFMLLDLGNGRWKCGDF